MNKLLVIGGPTATGKTGLGIKMAQRFSAKGGGEIVSADSRQVYRGMDIITGKDINKQISKYTNITNQFPISNFQFQIGYYEKDDTKIWLYDVVEPDQKFSVADYYELGWKVIEDIWARGKLPIMVGGTGFYVKAILEGIGTMGVEPDWELREKLQRCKVSELQRMLEDYSPERNDAPDGASRSRRMNESDRQNPRRLIRAIEIARNYKFQITNDKSISNFKFQISNCDTLLIGLTAPYEVLYQRIDQRVEKRVKMGAEEEIKKLFGKGYNWENSVLGTTIGYREWRDYFAGKATREEVIQKWKFAEHNYARRQMTWFRKMPQINWFDITKANWQREVEKLVCAWYS